MSSIRPIRVHLISLGCAKNTVDSETVLGELLGAGFELAVRQEDADLILINTCGFIESARRESYAVITEILESKDSGGMPRVVAMGCLSQRFGDELHEKFPDLDGVFGFNAYGRMAQVCRDVMTGEGGVVNRDYVVESKSGSGCGPADIYSGPRLLTSPGGYAYLRIAEGCNNRCAYCSIPDIRGPMRSRPPGDVVDEAISLEGMGVKEIILVAQDTTLYGRDLAKRHGLAQLLEALIKKTNIPRIRLLYAHPGHLDNDVMAILCGSDRLCRYLDVPVQHVNNRILRCMKRGYDRAVIETILARLRDSVPGMVLRTTVMVGFPGETRDEFKELLKFVEAGYFQHLGVFGFSCEQGTMAGSMKNQIAPQLIAERINQIVAAQQVVSFAWQDSRIGSEVEVMLDREVSPGLWAGRSISEAPEVDSEIMIKGTKFSHGDTFRACVIARDGYDIRAIPV